MEYPESHPKHAEIKELKTKIDELFRSVQDFEDVARVNYGEAMKSLSVMGESMKKRDDLLKELSDLMRKLEDVITSPLI